MSKILLQHDIARLHISLKTRKMITFSKEVTVIHSPYLSDLVVYKKIGSTPFFSPRGKINGLVHVGSECIDEGRARLQVDREKQATYFFLLKLKRVNSLLKSIF